MGKCGARELNYVSDVDVVFAFSPETTADGEQAERARSCASAAALQIIDLISAAGAEPALWEVDAALRPEGKAGALVRTVDEFAGYYSDIAENWEFQALFKARPRRRIRRTRTAVGRGVSAPGVDRRPPGRLHPGSTGYATQSCRSHRPR